jgi:hypothetical protein
MEVNATCSTNPINIVGQTLLALGLLVALAGDVMFLAVAFRRSLWWFFGCLFGCLFIPLVDIGFLLLNVKATAKPFGIAVLGLLIAVLGDWMAGVVWPG